MFQTYVNQQPAPGEAGDFAGANPRASTLAGPLGFIAAADVPASFGGALAPVCILGNFAWGVPGNGDPTVPGLASGYYQANALLGFLHRDNNYETLITAFLGEARTSVRMGFGLSLSSRGDFWASFPAGASIGQKVYADPYTGAPSAAAAGGSVSFAITASLATTGVLTVTVTAGTLAAGQVIVGVGIPAGSVIVSQLTGTAGSTGTYQLNQGVLVTSESMTAKGIQETPWSVVSAVPIAASVTGSIAAATGVLTVSAVGSGVLVPGQVITGTGIVGRAVITGQLTGSAGSTGTYSTNYVNRNAVGSTTIAAVQGTIGKISTWQA